MLVGKEQAANAESHLAEALERAAAAEREAIQAESELASESDQNSRKGREAI